MNFGFKKKLIYIRYIFPVVALCLIAILLFVPCYSYTTAEMGAQGVISLSELASNAWNQVCSYLFEQTGTKDNATLIFSKTVIGLIVGFAALFVISFVATVYQLIGVLQNLRNPDDKGTARILFMTLMPNRIVGFVLFLLAFPLLTFPHILTVLYEKMLHTYVTLTLTFPDPIILAAVLYVIAIVLSCVSRSYESALGMNPFVSYKKSVATQEDEYGNEE